MSARRPWRSTVCIASAAVTGPVAARALAGTATFELATSHNWAPLRTLPVEAAAAGCPDFLRDVTADSTFS
jgi:hypothetical protein